MGFNLGMLRRAFGVKATRRVTRTPEEVRLPRCFRVKISLWERAAGGEEAAIIKLRGIEGVERLSDEHLAMQLNIEQATLPSIGLNEVALDLSRLRQHIVTSDGSIKGMEHRHERGGENQRDLFNAVVGSVGVEEDVFGPFDIVEALYGLHEAAGRGGRGGYIDSVAVSGTRVKLLAAYSSALLGIADGINSDALAYMMTELVKSAGGTEEEVFAIGMQLAEEDWARNVVAGGGLANVRPLSRIEYSVTTARQWNPTEGVARPPLTNQLSTLLRGLSMSPKISSDSVDRLVANLVTETYQRDILGGRG